MSESKDNGIRLVRVEGENIRTLKTIAVRLDGEPGLYRATGKNAAGKTTFLDAVAMLFGGKKAVKENTIREGKDGAWCRGELNNGYSIERRFTASAPGGYLDMVTPDNASVKAPQSVLDGWCGKYALDPGALLRKKTSEIEAIILRLSDGLDEKRAELDAKREALAEERRPHNSTIQRHQRLKRPAGDRPEPVDVSAEMDRLKKLREVQDKRETLLVEISTSDSRCKRHEERIEMIDTKIARLKEERETVSTLWRQEQDAVQKAEADLEAIDNPADEISSVEARISEADAVSEALEPWREWDRSEAEVEEARAKADKLTTRIKALDEEEEKLLRSADIPVGGITFGDDNEMLLHGHPIEVASGMEKHFLALDIALAGNPDLKLVLLDEANDLDEESMEALAERVRASGLQALACRIGLEGPGEIVIEDGMALSRGAEGDPDLFDGEGGES